MPINFERGLDPKEAMGISKFHNKEWVAGKNNRKKPNNWNFNEKGQINVEGKVDLCNKLGKSEPEVEFNEVSGDFICSHNELDSLPFINEVVNGNFDCRNNCLINLKNAPKNVKGNFFCGNNKLPSEVANTEKCQIDGMLFTGEVSYPCGDYTGKSKYFEMEDFPVIINHSSDIDLTLNERQDLRLFLFGSKSQEIEKDSIQYLAYKIPIFLVSGRKMEEIKTKKKHKGLNNLLGYYTRFDGSLLDKKPVIFLCPEQIIKNSSSNCSYHILLAKVLVHEFAHALMDTNDSTFNCPVEAFDSGFFKFVEEAFANFITLKHFEKYHKESLDEVIGFIKKQDPEYALGETFYSKSFQFDLWKIWRAKKIDICKKSKSKNDWFFYVYKNSATITADGLKERFTDLLKY